ncbi:hypothetical protein E4T47_06414 [Aureobasidium subglaciale]|nr:hypothetical protein E4T47_06414 [Aureobasidium subglaciale]
MAPSRVRFIMGPRPEAQVIQIQADKVQKRKVKNKATDLAVNGTKPWDDAQRRTLIDLHAKYQTWKEVEQQLGRSPMACRGEFKKLRDGEREDLGLYQTKARACEAKRSGDFPNGRSTARMTAPRTPEDSVAASASTAIIGSPETAGSSDIELDGVFPEPAQLTPTTSSGSIRTTRSRNKEARHDSLPTQSQVDNLPVFTVSTPPKDVESNVRPAAEGIARQRMGTMLRALDRNTTVVAVDRAADDELDAVAYPAILSRSQPYTSRYTFRKEEAWVTTKSGSNRGMYYRHPWGFDVLCGPQWYSEAVTLRYNREQARKSCSTPVVGLSDAEADADLRLMS